MELRDYVEQLADIKARKSEIADEEKELNKELEEIEEHIAMIMLNDGQDKASFPGVGTVSPKVHHYPRIVDEQGFFDYLKSTEQAGMIKQVVPHQTLRAWFKDQVFEDPIATIGLADFTKTKINFRRK
jgi:hypothetical protein